MTEAQEAAATGTPLAVEYDGETYAVDLEGITLDAAEALEAAHYVTFIKYLLGEEQYQRYKAGHPRVVDLEPFVRALWAAVGQGNS